MEFTEETIKRMEEYEKRYGKCRCRFCGAELGLKEMMQEHYGKCKLFKELK